jgi:hypothetical protein
MGAGSTGVQKAFAHAVRTPPPNCKRLTRKNTRPSSGYVKLNTRSAREDAETKGWNVADESGYGKVLSGGKQPTNITARHLFHCGGRIDFTA